jgi:hypothetical protein
MFKYESPRRLDFNPQKKFRQFRDKFFCKVNKKKLLYKNIALLRCKKITFAVTTIIFQ